MQDAESENMADEGYEGHARPETSDEESYEIEDAATFIWDDEDRKKTE